MELFLRARLSLLLNDLVHEKRIGIPIHIRTWVSFDDISKCDSGFDRTFQSTIEAAPQCLIDLCAGDIGCLIDGVTLGIGAAKSYLRNPAINVVECSPSEPKPCYFSCADALQTLCVAESGLYEICPDGTNSMSVYCDQSTDGGGGCYSCHTRIQPVRTPP